jgi:monovalent cation/proton antiporter MnhG/PhaG subunit
MSVGDAFVYLLIGLGAASLLVACAGLVLARDFFDRLHISAPATLGTIQIVAALWARVGPSLIGWKGVATAVIVIVGSPLVTHALARAARIAERGDWRAGEDETVERAR